MASDDEDRQTEIRRWCEHSKTVEDLAVSFPMAPPLRVTRQHSTVWVMATK